MRRRRFLIPSLLAAGFGSHDAAAAAPASTTPTAGDDPDAGGLLRTFAQQHYVTLADHRSHSSHASHSSGYGGGGHYSHTSHRSSAGGGYYPTPLYDPKPMVPTPAPAPAASPDWSAPSSTPSRSVPASAQPLFDAGNRAAAPPGDGTRDEALPALSGRTNRFKAIVRRVQIALLARRYYAGAVDGAVGPRLRSALRRFQKDRGLEATGTITPQTLDALMVSSS